MIRVAIADDHAMFVDGIESILQSEANIHLVDKCFDGSAVFQMLAGDRIDVLLLDINLPVMSGIEVTSKIQKNSPRLRSWLYPCTMKRVLLPKSLKMVPLDIYLRTPDEQNC